MMQMNLIEVHVEYVSDVCVCGCVKWMKLMKLMKPVEVGVDGVCVCDVCYVDDVVETDEGDLKDVCRC